MEKFEKLFQKIVVIIILISGFGIIIFSLGIIRYIQLHKGTEIGVQNTKALTATPGISATATFTKFYESTPTNIFVATPTLKGINQPSPSPTITSIQSTQTPTQEIITPSTEPTETPKMLNWRQGKVVFSVISDHQNQIAVIDLSKSLTPEIIYKPVDAYYRLQGSNFSNDGSAIAFYELFGNTYILDFINNGSDPLLLRDCTGPSWSPDDSQIICKSIIRGNSFEVIDIETGQVDYYINLDENGVLPDWSEKNNAITYAAFFDGGITKIFTYSLLDQKSKTLAQEGSENYAPSWSPDGNWIAYQSNSNSQFSQIWIMDKDGNNKKQLTNIEGIWCRSPSWSPDGEWITFVSNMNASKDGEYGELYVVSLQTREIIRVTTTGGAVSSFRPSWTD